MIASILLVLAIIIAIYAKFYRAKLFGKILENFVRRLNPVFATGKEQLFNEGFKKVNRTNLNSPFKVLEIGVGTGSNFKFYPNNCDLTISDKSDEFVSYLKKSLQEMKREDLVINNFLVADAQNMKNIESNHFDVVVATFTLCSVDNFESVLNEIHRVLRPTGVFLFMDHSKDPKNSIKCIIQTIIQPLWSFVLDGCRFRDIKSEIEKHSKFDKLEIKEYKKLTGLVDSLLNPVFYGIGQKM